MQSSTFSGQSSQSDDPQLSMSMLDEKAKIEQVVAESMPICLLKS